MWLSLVSLFDSFVASTGISLEMSTVTVKEESEDPDYYQYNIPGNGANFCTCLSPEWVDCLSLALSVPLFLGIIGC